jgi:hypothetical protein
MKWDSGIAKVETGNFIVIFYLVDEKLVRNAWGLN